jgi:hypothetical protein
MTLARVVAMAVSLLIVSGSLLQPASAQVSKRTDGPDATQSFDPIDFGGRDEFEIADIAKVPAQVARAAEQSGCYYKEDIKRIPMRFLLIGPRRLVLVFCSGIIGTHQAFDLSDQRRPKPISFPFLARDSGFGTTPRPGAISWNKDAGLFEAWTGTDMCPCWQLRHIYRLGSTEGWISGAPTFVLVRVEMIASRSNGTWSTVWEAANWPPLALPPSR